MEIDSKVAKVNLLLSEVAKLLWDVGDTLNEIECSNEDQNSSLVRRLTRDGSLNITESSAAQYKRMACVYGAEERAHGFPWSYYVFCATHAKDPANWITECARQGWLYAQLRKQLAVKPRSKTVEDIISTPVKLTSVTVKPGNTVSAYVSITDSSEPTIEVSQEDECYVGLEECYALHSAVKQCLQEIDNYSDKVSDSKEEECFVVRL